MMFVYLKQDIEENEIEVDANDVETIPSNRGEILILKKDGIIVGEFPWDNIYGWIMEDKE